MNDPLNYHNIIKKKNTIKILCPQKKPKKRKIVHESKIPLPTWRHSWIKCSTPGCNNKFRQQSKWHRLCEECTALSDECINREVKVLGEFGLIDHFDN